MPILCHYYYFRCQDNKALLKLVKDVHSFDPGFRIECGTCGQSFRVFSLHNLIGKDNLLPLPDYYNTHILIYLLWQPRSILIWTAGHISVKQCIYWVSRCPVPAVPMLYAWVSAHTFPPAYRLHTQRPTDKPFLPPCTRPVHLCAGTRGHTHTANSNSCPSLLFNTSPCTMWAPLLFWDCMTDKVFQEQTFQHNKRIPQSQSPSHLLSFEHIHMGCPVIIKYNVKITLFSLHHSHCSATSLSSRHRHTYLTLTG